MRCQLLRESNPKSSALIKGFKGAARDVTSSSLLRVREEDLTTSFSSSAGGSAFKEDIMQEDNKTNFKDFSINLPTCCVKHITMYVCMIYIFSTINIVIICKKLNIYTIFMKYFYLNYKIYCIGIHHAYPNSIQVGRSFEYK